MIFNPLFIGENSSMQSLIPKSGKLANNKYLFSDIVKVVMNTAINENENPSLNLDGLNNGLKLGHESEQKLVQLKYRLLTDEHSEQVKSELADILPADIAQLLINEEMVTTNERAVSYISKEPLKGDLQKFLHGLIGAEIIEQNINQKSGLLLNLEDQKSAINIELVEEGNGKSASDKIIVQTLVVPEKSRLLSMFENGKNNEILFRTSGDSADKLFTSSSEIKLTSGHSEVIKPTLSVYSFSRDGNQFESLTKSLKSNETFKHNLDLLKNNSDNYNSTSAKSHLEKISFIPSELKNKSINTDGLKNAASANKITTDLKLVNPDEVKVKSDYSVSKITIVKKQDENNLLNSIKSKSELTSKEFESAFRRIDFNKPSATPKSGLHLINNTQSKNTSTDSGEIKILNSLKNVKLENGMTSSVNKELHTSKITESKIVNAENSTKNSNAKNTFENLTTKTDKNADINNISDRSDVKGAIKETDLKSTKNKANMPEEKTKVIEEASKPTSNANVKTDKLSDSKTKELKLETKTESVKINIKGTQTEKNDGDIKTSKAENDVQPIKVNEKKTENSTQVKTQITTLLENEVKQSSEGKSLGEKSSTEAKTEKIETKINDVTQKIAKNESNVNIKTDSTINNKSVSTDQSVNESKPISDLKADLKNNIADQDKTLSGDQVKKTNEKDNSQVSKENQEAKAATQNIVNPNYESNEEKDNKKFSVKVKGSIKSVSDKNDSVKNSIEDKPSNNTASNSEGGKSENSESKHTQNSSITNNQFEMKQHVETNFQQTLNKSEIGQLNFGDNKTTFVEPKVSPQIIKSVEVIKEISEFISKQTKGSLSFDIKPEHLGKMKITLDTMDKMLKANIEVETEQAKHLVEKNIDKLQQQLSNNGLQLNSLNISLSYSKQQRDGKKINNKTDNESESLGQVGEAEEEEKSKKQLGYNTYEYIA